MGGGDEQSDIEEIGPEVAKKKKKKIIKKIIKKKNPDGTDAPPQVIIIEKDANKTINQQPGAVNPMDVYGLSEANYSTKLGSSMASNSLSKQSSNSNLMDGQSESAS